MNSFSFSTMPLDLLILMMSDNYETYRKMLLTSKEVNEQLKNNPDVPLVIAAHPAHHRRIYKAIIKRKDEDTVFKWIMDEKGLRSKLSKTSEAGALKISLSFSLIPFVFTHFFSLSHSLSLSLPLPIITTLPFPLYLTLPNSFTFRIYSSGAHTH